MEHEILEIKIQECTSKYELTKNFSNELRFRILRNYEISKKSLKCTEL